MASFTPQNLLTARGLVQLLAQPDGNTVVAFDATMKEKHSRESPSTDYEVEDGTSASDHIVIKQFFLELNCFVSDTPSKSSISAVSGVAGVVASAANARIARANSGAGRVVSAAKQATVLLGALDTIGRRSAQVYNQLVNYQEARQAFTAVTSLYVYKNMFIGSLSAPRDAKTGRGVEFDLKLVQLRIVQQQTVNIVKFASPDLASGLADKGKQTPKKPSQLGLGIQDATKDATDFLKAHGINP